MSVKVHTEVDAYTFGASCAEQADREPEDAAMMLAGFASSLTDADLDDMAAYLKDWLNPSYHSESSINTTRAGLVQVVAVIGKALEDKS